MKGQSSRKKPEAKNRIAVPTQAGFEFGRVVFESKCEKNCPSFLPM